MDWIDTLAWVIRGRGLMTVVFVSFLATVYLHVPMQTEDSAASVDGNAVRAATR